MATKVATKSVTEQLSEEEKARAAERKKTEGMIMNAMNNRISTPEGMTFHLSCYETPAVIKKPKMVTNVVDGGAWVEIAFSTGHSIRTGSMKDRTVLIDWTQNHETCRFNNEKQYAGLFGPGDASFVKIPGHDFSELLLKVPETSPVPRHRYAVATGR